MSEGEIEEKVLKLLLDNGLCVSFVESCTGGMLASSLINVSGASGAIEQSFVTYSDKAKHKLAYVKNSTLKKYGAVSAETAKEMACGGARRAKSDLCVSVTGVAGPGLEEGKPVGLVYIGFFYRGKVKAVECHFEGDRRQIREAAVQKALCLIMDELS
ncbi:MAG: CinA family protein [Thermoflexaceae bacterium]|nr:CinA family protein [Thermoflexaceae bacterium]